jgi:hypothetical protein
LPENLSGFEWDKGTSVRWNEAHCIVGGRTLFWAANGIDESAKRLRGKRTGSQNFRLVPSVSGGAGIKLHGELIW